MGSDKNYTLSIFYWNINCEQISFTLKLKYGKKQKKRR